MKKNTTTAASSKAKTRAKKTKEILWEEITHKRIVENTDEANAVSDWTNAAEII